MRVFLAKIDEPLMAADGISRQHDSLKQLERIALHNRPVLISAGISLISVTNDKFLFMVSFSCHVPFDAGGEPGSASTPESGLNDFIHHLLGIHLVKRFIQRRISSHSHIFRHTQRVYDTAVL